jgi:NAD(P)-dependent dehydrogenase (short-subunit alcohol dehydrogenase family)
VGRSAAKRNRVALVTGAASGLGRATALRLAATGHRVFGTYLPVEPGDPAASIEPIPVDVDVDESVTAAVESVLAAAGHIDLLVNCAGFGIAGPVVETTIQEAHRQFETNVFGTLRMCQAVVPGMRERRRGTIVTIGSIGGIIALPFQGVYSATKFALEGLMEAMRMELRPFGIRVVLVEPADFHTGFTAARRTIGAVAGSPDRERFERAMKVIEHDEVNGSDPALVGELVTRIAGRRHPRLRYTVGESSERLAVLLKRMVPGWAFERIIRRHYRA